MKYVESRMLSNVDVFVGGEAFEGLQGGDNFVHLRATYVQFIGCAISLVQG